MKVQTYLFGSVEVNPDLVITFPNGLVGFEQLKRYLLVHESGSDAPVSFTLQSLDDTNVAFQIIEPAAMGFTYELALSDEEAALIEAPKAEEMAVMLVLYKHDNKGDSSLSANFRAPLIINAKARLGLQKVIERPRSNITISNLASPV